MPIHGRSGRRSLARLMQFSGAALMVAALAGSAFSSGPAYAKVAALAQVIAQALPPMALPSDTPSPPPAPSTPPTPTPTPVPTPQAHYHGGPLEFSLSGSVGLGRQSSSNTTTDYFGNPVVDTIAQTQETVGMLAELRHRSASSTFDIKVPLGISNMAGSQFGVGQISYSTPHFLIGYGSQTLDYFGQLALGMTQRGFFSTVPSGNGDLTFFEGPALGVQAETIRVAGVRGRRMVKGTLVEYGVFHSAPAPLTGSSTTAMLGFAASKGKSTLVAEGAVQDRLTPDGPLHGFAFQSRFDYGGTQTAGSLTLRSVPERFLSYGLGEVYADRFIDFGMHHFAQRHSSSIDVSQERSSYIGDITSSQRVLATIGGPLGAANYTLNLQNQLISGSQPTMWNGGAGLQLSVPLGSSALNVGSTVQRETQQGQAPIGTFNWNAQVQKNFRFFSLNVGVQRQRISSDTLGISKLASMNVGATKQFGKTSLGYIYTFTHTQTATTDATQITPQIVVSRQISPALALQMNYGTQHLMDALNPASNGRARIFGIQVNAPFTFGTGAVQGRVDPRLPATIQGRVISDVGANPTFAGYATSGLGNVVVVMDGTQLQRTDLDGNFQFSFVSPGQHQIRVESASLPRGLTVDQPVMTITVQGGQLAQASFLVGNFGSVAGHVFGTDANGAQIPLQNVMLRIDGGAYSQTDQQGTYGFGRLTPGQHKVAVVLASVPAFANFNESDLTRTVSVSNGEITPLDFTSEPLGSIEGKVLFGTDVPLPYVAGYGVLNAYVVAEPGEHAGIVNDDGSYVIDNLPPGAYSVSVDPETVPDGLGQTSSDINVNLGSQEHYQGAAFTIARKLKKVVFSFFSGSGAQTAQPTVELSERRLPPLGSAVVTVDDAAGAGSAKVEAFGETRDLEYDKARKVWSGLVTVPEKAKEGHYPVEVRLGKGTQPAAASLDVDPAMPLATVQVTPANAKVGDTATIRARFLVDARAGDQIRWQDNQLTTLGKPVSGRVFTFTLRISLRPLHGTLLTRHASLPIRIL